VQLSDVKGEFDILAQSKTADPVVMPTIAELQRVSLMDMKVFYLKLALNNVQIITEYCVLPIGHPEPSCLPAVNTLLLFGPRGTGKTMLVNAVAAETGAYLFNLSPKNTAGQFLGKTNVAKMVHMVFKVAKACPPAIIYIDNVEMIFAKKVPKDDTSDPKRIKKDLLKQFKSLSGEDRVLVIGTSYKPWDGEAKAVYTAFDKIIYAPKPDYPSRYALWRDFILKKAPSSSIRDLNLSLLTRMSHGLSAGTILLVCERVLTERRLKLVCLF
jgi:SpoVK/Ycf46/Vps4 family AAA+-type ATPase